MMQKTYMTTKLQMIPNKNQSKRIIKSMVGDAAGVYFPVYPVALKKVEKRESGTASNNGPTGENLFVFFWFKLFIPFLWLWRF